MTSLSSLPCATKLQPETARRIDDEIRRLFEAAHERVLGTLTAKREVLTSLAKRPIEKEVVSRDDLVALLASAEALGRHAITRETSVLTPLT
jgi:ATP-dependent Zn protease